MQTAERPKIANKADPRYFDIKTRGVKAIMVKAADGETERYLIQGTASSSVTDRYGDILTEACQASMLSQANGLTMWLNHSYNVPEDIAGTCIDPTLQRAVADDGSSCLDLLITLEIDPQNPRMMKSWESVNRGTKLAFSIGGYFTEFDFNPDDWSMIVNDIELLEISLVGIPANPRAYTKAFEVATEALRAEVVKRAEQIVKDAGAAKPDSPQVRMLIRKSFGFAEEVETMNKCSEAGCENDIADGLETDKCSDHFPATTVELAATVEALDLSGDHTPTVTLDAEVPEKKSVQDPAQQSALVECMKSMAMAVGHGMCQESATHVGTAHAIVKAMLPDGYDLPDDAQLAAPAVIVKVAPVTVTYKQGEQSVTIEASTTELATEIQTLLTQETGIKDSVNQLSSETEALKTQKADLEKQIADLKATPTGRSTKSHSGGSSNGSESTVTPEMYQRNSSEQAEAAGRQMRGTPSDARQSAQAVLPPV